MEKVKITPEQANAIKKWINKELLIIAKASGLLEHGVDEPIAELTMKQLVKAIYIGYEVEPEFKVGDWVFWETKSNGPIPKTAFKIEKIIKDGVCPDEWPSPYAGGEPIPIEELRHATPSEIAEEKERRWWAKHGRNLWELRKGDLLIDKHFGKIAEVREVEDKHYLIGAITSYESLDFIKRNYTVVCFSEQRLDLEGE